MDQKLDPLINKLDAILGEVQKHREEDVIGAQQLRRRRSVAGSRGSDQETGNHPPSMNYHHELSAYAR